MDLEQKKKDFLTVIARAMYFEVVDSMGYPNGMMTWDEMTSCKHAEKEVEYYMKKADMVYRTLENKGLI